MKTWASSLAAMKLLLLSIVYKTEALTACDLTKYPGIGCPDQLTTICDTTTNKCICNPENAIMLRGKCYGYKNINEQCYSSKQCTRIDAKCLTALGTEIKGDDAEDKIANSSPVDAAIITLLLNINQGFCQCPEGSYHNMDKRKCQKQILNSKCSLDNQCSSVARAYCDAADNKCKCELGYRHDLATDSCRSLLASGSDPHAHLNMLCDFGFVFDRTTQRCRAIVPHWDSSARSWSSFVWKVAVLCIVLVLLMMLVSGVQRARHHDNLMSWSRALEQYSQRDTFSGISRGSSHRRTTTELRLVMGTATLPPLYPGQSISPLDEPPSYEEAVRMSNGAQASATITINNNLNGSQTNLNLHATTSTTTNTNVPATNSNSATDSSNSQMPP